MILNIINLFFYTCVIVRTILGLINGTLLDDIVGEIIGLSLGLLLGDRVIV